MMSPLLFVLLCIYSCSSSVIVSKNLGGEGHVTQGSELLVTIQLFNTLNTPIFDVSLADNWAEDFESVTGLTKATWESIPALSTVSHSYIVRPLKPGYTEFSRADVSYRYLKKNMSFRSDNRNDKHGELQFVQSTHENQYVQGWVQIFLGSEVDLRSGVHTKAWIIFLIVSFSTVATPLAYYFYLNKNYVDGKLKKD